MVKMIVSDIDGTLLRSDQTISRYLIEVLKKCQRAGIRIVLASARPPRMTRNLCPTDFRIDAFINYNGALVSENGNVLYQKTLRREVIEEIIGVVREKIVHPRVCFEINDAHYASFDIFDTFGRIPFQRIDLKTFKTNTAHKIILCNMANENRTELLGCFPADCTCMVTDGDQLCQIMDTNVSKFNALRFLLDRYEIETDEVMCFGDDRNDIEMLLNCGISVAMENASPEVKETAKHGTTSNDEDGVAVFIEDYLSLR